MKKNDLNLVHLKVEDLIPKYVAENDKIRLSYDKLEEAILIYEKKPASYFKQKIEALSKKLYDHIIKEEYKKDLEALELPHKQLMSDNGLRQSDFPLKIRNHLVGFNAQTGIFKRSTGKKKEEVKERLEKMSASIWGYMIDYLDAQEEEAVEPVVEEKEKESVEAVKEEVKKEPKEEEVVSFDFDDEEGDSTPPKDTTAPPQEVTAPPKKKTNIEILEEYINGSPEKVQGYPALTVQGLKKLGYDISRLRRKGQDVKDENGNIVFWLRKGEYDKYYKIKKNQ